MTTGSVGVVRSRRLAALLALALGLSLSVVSQKAKADDVPLIAFDNWDHPTVGLARADGTGFRKTSIVGHDPEWSPDGTELAYVEYNYQAFRIHVIDGDGSDRLIGPAMPQVITDVVWSPDGTTLSFLTFDNDGWGGIFSMPVANGENAVPVPIVQRAQCQELEDDPFETCTTPWRGGIGGPAYNDAGTRIGFTACSYDNTYGTAGHNPECEIWSVNLQGQNEVVHTDFCDEWYDENELLCGDSDAPTDCPGAAGITGCFVGGQLDWQGQSFVVEIIVDEGESDADTDDIGEYAPGSADAVTYRVNANNPDETVSDPALSPTGVLAYTRFSDDDAEVMVEGVGSIAAGRDPAWQPCPNGTCAPFFPDGQPSTVTLNYSAKKNLKGYGKVSPNAAGQKVVVKLFVKKGQQWDLKQTERPVVKPDSRFLANFKTPTDWECRLTVRYPGRAGPPKILPSTAKKEFLCWVGMEG